MEMPSFLMALDPYLIWFYRLPGNACTGFFLGTFVLAFFALIIGEITIFLASRLAGKHLDAVASETLRYQDLSIEAAKAGDKASYMAANKLANEAFGKSFFSLAALSMARLWPAPFALAWMQYRFFEVEFPIPGTGFAVGYMAPFIVLYIVAYQIFKRLKHRLSFFRPRKAILDTHLGEGQKTAN
jgi:hypothetical protein